MQHADAAQKPEHRSERERVDITFRWSEYGRFAGHRVELRRGPLLHGFCVRIEGVVVRVVPVVRVVNSNLQHTDEQHDGMAGQCGHQVCVSNEPHLSRFHFDLVEPIVYEIQHPELVHVLNDHKRSGKYRRHEQQSAEAVAVALGAGVKDDKELHEQCE